MPTRAKATRGQTVLGCGVLTVVAVAIGIVVTLVSTGGTSTSTAGVSAGSSVTAEQTTLLLTTDPPQTTDPQQALRDAFPDKMRALGFFPGGGPDYTLDASADAVCGNLQTTSMRAEIAYEESTDKGTLTGMTTNKDIIEFITDSVRAFCPQYAAELPAP